MHLNILNNTIFENVQNSNGKFIKHFHDTYTIGITHDGIFKSINQNKATNSYKYSTRIINPNEIHCGDSNSWKYTNFYPTIEFMAKLYQEIYLKKHIPIFEKHIIEDTNLYKLLLEFFISSFKKEDSLVVETNLINALSYLIKNYAQKEKNSLILFDDKTIIKNSLEYINDCIGEELSLDNLAKNSNLSKYHFLRIFKKSIGITPHQYIITQRVQKAKEMILKGEKLTTSALNVGFSDQSHFIKNFKNIYGYLPKNLLDDSNFFLYKK